MLTLAERQAIKIGIHRSIGDIGHFLYCDKCHLVIRYMLSRKTASTITGSMYVIYIRIHRTSFKPFP